jgi:hypothetical protein
MKMENIMFYKGRIAALAIVVACAASSSASAAIATWPGRIIGIWKGQANQTSVVLHVLTQTGAGKCQDITGTLLNVGGGTDNIYGYYCPGSGAVEFRRFSASFTAAIQVYSGYLNQANAGAPSIFMAGTFSQYNLSDGPLGQYSFSLTY